MALSRVQRLVRLITLLQSSPGLDAHDLMDEMGVSRRTLFRDFAALKAAGIPVYHDKDEGYRLQRGFYLPPINLTAGEVVGLLLLGRIASADRSRPMTGAALSAIRKLIASVPASIREVCSALVTTVDVKPDRVPVDDQAEGKWYGVLQPCIDQGRVCRATYRAAAEPDPVELNLHPYLLHFVNRAWYVLGWSPAHGEVRVFKLVRFRDITPTDERFDRPDYTATDKLGNAWQLIPGGEEHDIELIFSQMVSDNVGETLWHATQQQERLADGRLRVTFRVDGLDEIAWWLCGYADQVEIVKPFALRERVCAMHRRAAESLS